MEAFRAYELRGTRKPVVLLAAVTLKPSEDVLEPFSNLVSIEPDPVHADCVRNKIMSTIAGNLDLGLATAGPMITSFRVIGPVRPPEQAIFNRLIYNAFRFMPDGPFTSGPTGSGR